MLLNDAAPPPVWQPRAAATSEVEPEGPELRTFFARARDEQFHTTLHFNCMPRLQPLATGTSSAECNGSSIVLCVGVPLFPCVPRCRQFPGDDTTFHYIGIEGSGVNPLLTETMIKKAKTRSATSCFQGLRAQ